MDQRFDQLVHWVRQVLGGTSGGIAPASEDASFRRYFRITGPGTSLIAMDAPPEREDSARFVRIARWLGELGLHVPEIVAADPHLGFVLMEDLGDTAYLKALSPDTVGRLYGDAQGALIALQAAPWPQVAPLPQYDRPLLERELAIFTEWLLGRHLALPAAAVPTAMLEPVFERLVGNALDQPRVVVHRDFHSRNLMVRPTHNPGILDFQDAVIGPVTYDLVSLLRDCYIAWPPEQVVDWVIGYQRLALESGVLRDVHEDEDRFLAWFDWMGVQRHLKAAGIFARLWHRDGKAGFLADIPRTLGYATQVCARYPGLHDLGEWLEQQVVPRLPAEAAR